MKGHNFYKGQRIESMSGVEQIPFVFGVDQFLSDGVVWFHSSGNIIFLYCSWYPFCDTFHIRKDYHAHTLSVVIFLSFLLAFLCGSDHINQIDTSGSIKFTYEKESEGRIPFLDTYIVKREDGTVKLLVYRKPTHTDQYLNYNSHHPLHQKLGVIRTLLDRKEHIVTEEADRKEEEQHVVEALTFCGYPTWTFDKVKTQKENTITIDVPLTLNVLSVCRVNGNDESRVKAVIAIVNKK